MSTKIQLEYTLEEAQELLAILDFARTSVRIDQVYAILQHYHKIQAAVLSAENQDPDGRNNPSN